MKTYTPEKKQEAIDRFISGESVAAILADIGIPKSTFYKLGAHLSGRTGRA